MRRGGAALLAILAGCTSYTYTEPMPYPVEPPPYLPEILFRQPADFRINDVPGQREYFLYFYEDFDVRQELITLIDRALPEAEQAPRPADPAEHEYAMQLFLRYWQQIGDGERLEYFMKRHREELERNATDLDPMIRYKAESLKRMEEEKIDLEADLRARDDAKVFNEPEKMRFLEQQIGRRQYEILLTEAQLRILEYKRHQRDALYTPPPLPGPGVLQVEVKVEAPAKPGEPKPETPEDPKAKPKAEPKPEAPAEPPKQ